MRCEGWSMTRHRLLTKDEFRECFTDPLRNMTAAPEAATDIWPYVDSLDPKGLGFTEIGDVTSVYRDGKARYDQVLLQTDTANLFLVIIVDLSTKAVRGHHFLDLNARYDAPAQH